MTRCNLAKTQFDIVQDYHKTSVSFAHTGLSLIRKWYEIGDIKNMWGTYAQNLERWIAGRPKDRYAEIYEDVEVDLRRLHSFEATYGAGSFLNLGHRFVNAACISAKSSYSLPQLTAALKAENDKREVMKELTTLPYLPISRTDPGLLRHRKS